MFEHVDVIYNLDSRFKWNTIALYSFLRFMKNNGNYIYYLAFVSKITFSF
jgi:hypothetical protein